VRIERFARLGLVLVLMACCGELGFAVDPWDVTLLEDGTGFRQTTSIAILPSGQPAVSYYDEVNRDLMYAWFDGAAWHTSVVDGAGWVGEWSSLAILPNGYPAISYYDETHHDLKYAEFDGLAWQLVTLDTENDVGKFTSIAVLPSGQPAISYRRVSGGRLMYAWRDVDGVTWQTETVEDTENDGGYSSLVILPDGNPGISHYEYTYDDLKFTWHDGAGWQTVIVDDAGDVGTWSSAAVLPSGQPCIAYYDATNGDLKYAWRDGDGQTWHTSVVHDGIDVGKHCSLAVLPSDRVVELHFDGERGDLAGQPIIAYFNFEDVGTTRDLCFAWYDGAQWKTTTVDSSGYTGPYCSLAVLPSGEPIISYNDWDWRPGDLNVAEHIRFGWELTTVHEGQQVGEYAALTVLPDGRPAISYYRWFPYFDLNYVARSAGDPDQWDFSVVAADGNTGKHTSINVQPGTGEPAIAFAENAWGRGLWYTESDGGQWPAVLLDEAETLYTSLLMLPSGAPGISYCQDDDLKFIQRDVGDPNTWHITIIDSEANVGYWTSAAIVPATGEPAISYYDETNGDLKYAERDVDGTAWHVVTVDAVGEVGEGTGLAFLPSGVPAISYYDATNTDLRYAYRDAADPNQWHLEVVDSDGSVGQETSLVVLPDGQPAIAYRDDLGNQLKYARYDGANWQISVVDDGGDPHWISLAVLQTGQPAVAWRNRTHGDLMYAEIAAPCAGWVNVYDECPPGQPFAEYQSLGGDWGTDQWAFHWQLQVPGDAAYALQGIRSYVIEIKLNGVNMDYLGNGVWVRGDAVATFAGADGYEVLDPSWPFLYSTPQSFTLPYPYIELGSACPGGVVNYDHYIDWVNQPAASSKWYASDVFGYAFVAAAADLDCSGDVDLADLAVLQRAFGACSGAPAFEAAADLDGSGCVDLADLTTLLAAL
jgi:hypothetical protein